MDNHDLTLRESLRLSKAKEIEDRRLLHRKRLEARYAEDKRLRRGNYSFDIIKLYEILAEYDNADALYIAQKHWMYDLSEDESVILGWMIDRKVTERIQSALDRHELDERSIPQPEFKLDVDRSSMNSTIPSRQLSLTNLEKYLLTLVIVLYSLVLFLMTEKFL